MTKRVEKGDTGASANYITRAKALKRLQLSLSDFRKLCILKGVYPRTPPKASSGADKTYYHTRDIRLLSQDTLRSVLYARESMQKKLRNRLGSGAVAAARKMQSEIPQLDMSKTLRERYPTFESALLDLDDCLSTVALMSSLQSSSEGCIDSSLIADCRTVYMQFLAYVANTGSLMKVFASIKGFYLQAKMPTGAVITWLHPHNFTHSTPADVDSKVLVTFSDWYRALLKFVTFKLYSDIGWKYNQTKEVSSLVEMCARIGFLGQNALFQGMAFSVSREVCAIPTILTIISGGGKIVQDTTMCSHCIIDKPLQAIENVSNGCDYAQPQWIFDCFNENIILSIRDFAPGACLPPHLSPFIGSDAEYLPRRRQFLDSLKSEVKSLEKDEVLVTTDLETQVITSIDEETGTDRHLTRVQKHVVHTTGRVEAVLMLSKKHRRLLSKIEGSSLSKRAAAEKLRRRAAK